MNRFIIPAIATAVVMAIYQFYKYYKRKRLILPEGYFISTQGMSGERLKNLGMDKASVDASDILDLSKLNFPTGMTYEDADFGPKPELEWIIELATENGALFHRKDFDKVFDYEWRTQYSSTLYGFTPEENRWTYADAGGTPETYNSLKIGIRLLDAYGDNTVFEPGDLERYLVEVKKKIKNYPTTVKVICEEPIESAIARAEKLVSFSAEFKVDAVILLQKDNGTYNGMEAWDALQSVGLTWGDGDLFHWWNEELYGHDRFFSVGTTTAPGYFLPEEVKIGNMNPQNLLFGFTIPRSADAKNVYEIMLVAAKYCQQRLGGQLYDKYRAPLNEEKERKNISDVLNGMEKRGIPAGSGRALMIF